MTTSPTVMVPLAQLRMPTARTAVTPMARIEACAALREHDMTSESYPAT